MKGIEPSSSGPQPNVLTVELHPPYFMRVKHANYICYCLFFQGILEAMAQAARAIIMENGKILVMRREKQGSIYFTLVGGRVNEGEDITATVVREVREETGLMVTNARYVFYEAHPEPYNEQYIFLCEIAPHDNIKIQEASEEALLNRFGTNLHEPMWAEAQSFEKLPFRTPQLQKAITAAVRKGFPAEPVRV